MGSGVMYNLYISNRPDGVFTKVNSVPFADNGAGNNYEITGLLSNNIYYVYVTEVKNGIDMVPTYITESTEYHTPKINAVGVKTYAIQSVNKSVLRNAFRVV
jgi:hypothetical protein